MSSKKVFRSVILIVLFITSVSFSMEPIAKRYNPAGTWKFSIPYAPEGYTQGNLIITKEDKKSYSVVFALDEYYKITANEVVYNKKEKEITFILYVETETVRLSGTFEDDKFTGTANYSEGVLDITAVREKEE